MDGNSNVLQIAEAHSRDCPEIQFARHDLRSLPYAADSFDIVLCSLALHHFGAADAVAILRRIHELAGLATQAGLANYHIRRHHLLFRMVLSGRK